MVITYSRVWINRVKLQILLVVRIFPCPRSRLRNWSRETGPALPSRISLVILHTQAESGIRRSRCVQIFLRNSSVMYVGSTTYFLKTCIAKKYEKVSAAVLID